MKFRSYEALRVFNVAARTLSFTQAGSQLNLTKGAISYQIKRLEEDLGFRVFNRTRSGISLTDNGSRVLQLSQSIFDTFEVEVEKLKKQNNPRITIGMSTYFASRWLASRLMDFTASYPTIGIRLQPMIDLVDLKHENIDLAIRWGNGNWSDMHIEPLFNCPAIATAGKTITADIKTNGLAQVIAQATLLHDRDDSSAWQQWHSKANLPYRSNRDDLVIPDPNVRVQAVINGQGLALNDSLVNDEINEGKLFKISSIELEDYGYYLAYDDGALEYPELRYFRDWISQAAIDYKSAFLTKV